MDINLLLGKKWFAKNYMKYGLDLIEINNAFEFMEYNSVYMRQYVYMMNVKRYKYMDRDSIISYNSQVEILNRLFKEGGKFCMLPYIEVEFKIEVNGNV